jgi:hypothetical protein
VSKLLRPLLIKVIMPIVYTTLAWALMYYILIPWTSRRWADTIRHSLPKSSPTPAAKHQ